MTSPYWWIELVHKETGVILPRPVFVVKAKTYELATAEVEKNLDREEYPPDWSLQAQIMEFGEMGPNVAWL